MQNGFSQAYYLICSNTDWRDSGWSDCVMGLSDFYGKLKGRGYEGTNGRVDDYATGRRGEGERVRG